MIRLSLILVLAASPLAALAATDTCRVAGTAYDYHGRPLHAAVVRLVDTRTQQAIFRATDTRAGFDFAGLAAADYRLDVLSAPTRVTGTHIPTRSILGMSNRFVCGAGQLAHQDVRVQVD
jgi:hypothetical protein